MGLPEHAQAGGLRYQLQSHILFELDAAVRRNAKEYLSQMETTAGRLHYAGAGFD